MGDKTHRQFDEKHIYLQWLNRRRPAPARWDPWYTIGIWILQILALISPVTFFNIVDPEIKIGFFFTIFIAIDFLFFMPRCLQDDMNHPIGRDIFNTPVLTRSIIFDLRIWGSIQFIKHNPLVILLIGILFLDYYPITTNSEFILALLFPIILGYLFLGIGICAAALPRWLTTSGLVFLGIFLPIFFGGFFISKIIASRIFLATESSKIIAPGVHLVLEPPPGMVLFLMFVLLLVLVCILEWLAPRLLEMRRQGKWE